jgi:hypothetical protein
MRRLEIAALALLVGWCVSAPTSADAGPALPHSFPAAATHGDILLIQYGGGDDDDDRPPRNNNGGGYQQPYRQQHHNNNNNFNNGAAAAGAIIGIIGAIQEQQRQKRLREQYNNDIRIEQAKRNQEIRNKRAKELERIRERKKEADRIKHIEEEKEREDAKRDEEKKKQKLDDQRPAANQYQPQPEAVRPASNERDPDPDPYHDVDDNHNTINIVPPPDNCPDNFSQLKIGPTVLYPRRTDYPADSSLCGGRTAKGCYLRVVNGPATCGGGRPVCVAYCDVLPPPVKRVDPIPPPVKHADPIPVPPPACTGPSCREQRDRACANPPCVTPSVVVQKPEEQKQPVPPVKTDKATKVVEEEHKQPVPPVKTDKATKVVEEEHKQPVPPVKTDKATKVVEEEHKQPVPPVKTDKATKVVEEEHKQPVPPVKTDKATKVVEEEHKQPVSPVKTDKAIKVVEKMHDDKSPEPADSREQGGQIDEASFTQPPPPPAGEDCMRYIDPMRYPNFNLSNWRQDPDYLKCEGRNQKAADEKNKQKEKAAVKKKENDDWQKFVENPGPPDSKGCTSRGDIPIKTLLADPNYGKVLSGADDIAPISTEGKFEKLHLRAITTAGLKLVPEVGSVLSGAVDFLWKDPKSDRLFDEMLDYVNRLVPDSITKERLGQQKYDIVGLSRALKAYKEEGDLFQKGLDLKILTKRLAELEQAYLDDPETPPERALPLVVAYGKLRLAALQEQLLHQKEYFPNHASTSLVSDYNDAVDVLTTKARAMKAAIIANRLSKIHLNEEMHDAKDEGPISEGGMFMGWPQAHYFSVHDDFCAWNPAEHKEDRAPAQAEFDNRMAGTKNAYERDLDMLLAPITNWPSLTPKARAASADGHPLDEGASLDEAMPSAYIDRNGLTTLGDADGTELGGFAGEVLKSLPLALANSCTRHLRNDSNDTWEVRGVEGSGVCEKPGSCVAKPHSTIEIHFPVLEQQIKITITAGGQSAFNDTFKVKQGNLITTGNCAYIEHDGSTGKVRLNQPADGDITALNMDAAHRLKRRMESIKRITNSWKRRKCLENPSKCRYARDD